MSKTQQFVTALPCDRITRVGPNPARERTALRSFRPRPAPLLYICSSSVIYLYSPSNFKMRLVKSLRKRHRKCILLARSSHSSVPASVGPRGILPCLLGSLARGLLRTSAFPSLRFDLQYLARYRVYSSCCSILYPWTINKKGIKRALKRK